MKAWLKLNQTKNPPNGNILEIEGENYCEISLTDYMIEFAEWLKEREYEICNREQISFSTSELLEIYFKEKGIII